MAAAGLSEQDVAALTALADADARIVMARDWDALAAQYAPDAVRMPPNQPAVQGRDAIRAWFEQLPPIPSFSFRLVDVRGQGDVAYMHAAYTLTVTGPGGAPLHDTGKILVVLRKGSDGSWLRVADAWNSDLPPPGA